MVIEKRNDGAELIYSVCADVRETGEKHPREIISLPTLETASLVLKYLRGDRMTLTDQATAQGIIRDMDTRYYRDIVGLQI